MSDVSSKKIHDISKVFLDLATEIQELKEEIKSSQTRIGYLEAQLRSKHLTTHGTPEAFASAQFISSKKGSDQITQDSGEAVIECCATRSPVSKTTAKENKKWQKYEDDKNDDGDEDCEDIDEQSDHERNKRKHKYEEIRIFESICESPYCQRIFHECRFDVSEECLKECPICLENLENKVTALMSNCDHIFCADCAKSVRNLKRSLKLSGTAYRCPYCRQYSHSVMHTTKLFDGAKEALYKEHSNCFEKDPFLQEVLEKLNPQWRLFIGTLLREETHINVPYKLGQNEFLSRILCSGPKYSISVNTARGQKDVIVCCTFEGVSIQVFILSGRWKYGNRCDNEYADKVVDWLNQQVTSSHKALHGCLNPNFNLFIMWRRFSRVNCVLKMSRLTKSIPYDVTDGLMKSELNSIHEHNFTINENVTKNKYMSDISSSIFPKIHTRFAKIDIQEILDEHQTVDEKDDENILNDDENILNVDENIFNVDNDDFEVVNESYEKYNELHYEVNDYFADYNEFDYKVNGVNESNAGYSYVYKVGDEYLKYGEECYEVFEEQLYNESRSGNQD